MTPTLSVRPGVSVTRHPQRGLSLIELMIALTIGMLIMAALGALMLSITRNNSELAKANAQIENGRFAIQLLQNDLVHAGFWGELTPEIPSAIPDPCLPVVNWETVANYKADMLGVPVLGYSSSSIVSSSTCTTGTPPPISQMPQTNSDVLVVRHANTCVTGAGCDGDTTANPDDGPHIQVSRCTTSSEDAYVIEIDADDLTLTNKDCATPAAARKVVSNIYYVKDNTLMRSALVDGAYQTQPLIEGIEALRFEYGIDSTGDGSPDGPYVSCDPCALAQLANVVAVKVHVLARNLEATPGYKDTKAYKLGATSYTVPAADVGFKRHVFSTTVRLVNPSGRREVP